MPRTQKVLNRRGQPGLPWGLSLGLLTGMTLRHALSPTLVEESRSNIKISMALHMCVCASVCVFLVISTCSLPVSSDHWIFQARILKQVAIFYSKGSYRFRGQTLISCVSCIGRFFTLRHLGSLYVCICVYICMCAITIIIFTSDVETEA